MCRQGLVEFRGDIAELVETGPWDGREVVVLIVEAHVVGEEVQCAVVAVRLRGGDSRG